MHQKRKFKKQSISHPGSRSFHKLMLIQSIQTLTKNCIVVFIRLVEPLTNDLHKTLVALTCNTKIIRYVLSRVDGSGTLISTLKKKQTDKNKSLNTNTWHKLKKSRKKVNFCINYLFLLIWSINYVCTRVFQWLEHEKKNLGYVWYVE